MSQPPYDPYQPPPPGWGAPQPPPGWGAPQPPPGYAPPPGYVPPPGYAQPFGQPPAGALSPYSSGQPGPPPASPGRRLGAKVIDGLLLVVALGILAGVLIGVVVQPHAVTTTSVDGVTSTTIDRGIGGIVAVVLLALLLGFLYDPVLTALRGGSLGKAMLGLRVVRTDGSRVGWGAAFGRSAVAAGIGFLPFGGLLDSLWCTWDPRRQCVHDKAAGTLVVATR